MHPEFSDPAASQPGAVPRGDQGQCLAPQASQGWLRSAPRQQPARSHRSVTLGVAAANADVLLGAARQEVVFRPVSVRLAFTADHIRH